MKKLSKTIFSIAAVTAVSAVMAASAMAMSASYADGVVTLTDVDATGDSQTLLVLSENADTVTEGIIKQIDQKDDGTKFGAVTVGDLVDGTYYVRVGGTDGTLQTAEFTVGTQGGEDPVVETIDIYIGDANLDNAIDSLDVGNVLRYTNKETTRVGRSGEKYKYAADETIFYVGDANVDGAIDSLDVGNILRYANKETTRIGKISTTPVTVEKTPIAE